MSVEGAVQPIGASLVHFLERNDHHHDDDRADSTGHAGTNDNGNNQILPMDTSESHDASKLESSMPTTATKISVPFVHHPCLLLDGCHQINNNDRTAATDRRRILVCGPPRSGKTSVALNLAYSMAGSAAPCLCFDPRMCRCTAVTIYKAALTAGAADEDFPLHCRPVVAQSVAVENDHAIATQNRDVPSTNQDHHSMPNEREKGKANDQTTADHASAFHDNKTSLLDWDPQVLKRIRMHRVTSVRELLQDLLCLLGKPLQEQPRAGGAIVIDDIDKIAAMPSSQDGAAAATSMNGNTSWNQGNAHHTTASAVILQISTCGLCCRVDECVFGFVWRLS